MKTLINYRHFGIRQILQGILLFLLVVTWVDNTAAQGKEWNYVVLGDSQSRGPFPLYAGFLERDLTVKIKIDDRTVGNQYSSALLQQLRGNPDLQRALREANVVTVNIPTAVFRSAGPLYNAGKCGGADNQDCYREALKVYQADTIAIFAEIVSLSNPSKTLIRTMDTHQLLLKNVKAQGRFEVVKFYWQALNKCVIEVATKYRIPVARVYATFNGPNGDEDAQEKGLVSEDGMHGTPKGNDVIARLFKELGYQYAVQ